MKCEEVRIQLAAYRRSEWTAIEQQAVRAHLMECASCRRWESEARGVGEHLRHLPTISPPAAFRDRVFATIRAEEAAIAQGMVTPLAPDDLPVRPTPRPINAPVPIADRHPVRAMVVERIGEVGMGRLRGRRILFGKTTAIATVAALFLVVFTTHFMTLFNVNTPTSKGGPLCIACNLPSHYAVDARYPLVTSVIATTDQVVYSAQNASGKQMLFIQDRQSKMLTPLLSTPSVKPLTVQGITDNVLVWLSGTPTADWTLNALIAGTDGTFKPAADTTLLLLGEQGQPLANSYVTAIQGVWVDHKTVVVALALANQTTLIQKIDLSRIVPIRTAIAQTKIGHHISDLYLDGTTLYWVDSAQSLDGVPHSVLVRQHLANGAEATTFDTDAYRPVGSQQHIAWFESSSTIFASDGNGTPELRQVGTVVTLAADGSIKPISGDNVLLSNVWRGVGYIFWRDESGAHVYHLADGTKLDQDVPAGAVTLGLSANAIAWAKLPNGSDTSSAILVLGE